MLTQAFQWSSSAGNLPILLCFFFTCLPGETILCNRRVSVLGKSKKKNANTAVKRNGRGILCVKRADHKQETHMQGRECWVTVFKRNANTGLRWAHRAQWHCSAQPALDTIDPFSFYLLTQAHTGVCISGLQTHGTGRALRQVKISWRHGRKQTPQNGGLNGWI